MSRSYLSLGGVEGAIPPFIARSSWRLPGSQKSVEKKGDITTANPSSENVSSFSATCNSQILAHLHVFFAKSHNPGQITYYAYCLNCSGILGGMSLHYLTLTTIWWNSVGFNQSSLCSPNKELPSGWSMEQGFLYGFLTTSLMGSVWFDLDFPETLPP